MKIYVVRKKYFGLDFSEGEEIVGATLDKDAANRLAEMHKKTDEATSVEVSVEVLDDDIEKGYPWFEIYCEIADTEKVVAHAVPRWTVLPALDKKIQKIKDGTGEYKWYRAKVQADCEKSAIAKFYKELKGYK